MKRYRVWTQNGKYVLVANLTKTQAEKIKRALPKNAKASIKSYNVK